MKIQVFRQTNTYVYIKHEDINKMCKLYFKNAKLKLCFIPDLSLYFSWHKISYVNILFLSFSCYIQEDPTFSQLKTMQFAQFFSYFKFLRLFMSNSFILCIIIVISFYYYCNCCCCMRRCLHQSTRINICCFQFLSWNKLNTYAHVCTHTIIHISAYTYIYVYISRI